MFRRAGGLANGSPPLGRNYAAKVDQHEEVWQSTQAAAPSLVGLPKADAERRAADLGLRVRMVDWDEPGGTGRVALTADLRIDRVTVHVRNGVVTQADPG
jgi:hypothetical protein